MSGNARAPQGDVSYAVENDLSFAWDSLERG